MPDLARAEELDGAELAQCPPVAAVRRKGHVEVAVADDPRADETRP